MTGLWQLAIRKGIITFTRILYPLYALDAVRSFDYIVETCACATSCWCSRRRRSDEVHKSTSDTSLKQCCDVTSIRNGARGPTEVPFGRRANVFGPLVGCGDNIEFGVGRLRMTYVMWRFACDGNVVYYNAAHGRVNAVPMFCRYYAAIIEMTLLHTTRSSHPCGPAV